MYALSMRAKRPGFSSKRLMTQPKHGCKHPNPHTRNSIDPHFECADTRTEMTLADSLVHPVDPGQERMQGQQTGTQGSLRSGKRQCPFRRNFLQFALSLFDTWKGSLTLFSTAWSLSTSKRRGDDKTMFVVRALPNTTRPRQRCSPATLSRQDQHLLEDWVQANLSGGS